METGKQVSPRVSVSPFARIYLSTPSRILLWLLPLSFLIVSFFYPLSRILVLTFDPGALTTQHSLLAFRVLLFTFYQAAL